MKMHDQFKEIDPNELKLPDTVFIRDIETRVFQAIVIRCLAEVEGVYLLEGNLIDDLLGREGDQRVKGIHVEQDQKNHSVSIKVEINMVHGVSIPEKSEEIQTTIATEVTRLTGLHVACVHIIFKSLISQPSEIEKVIPQEEESLSSSEV